VSTDDRCHQLLIVATNSANGGFQSTPVIWEEIRDRHVWVERAHWNRAAGWRFYDPQRPLTHDRLLHVI